MKRIGIFGGTFDPVHCAHLIAARMAAEQHNLDRVMFITGGNPPHKRGITDAEIRFEMVNLALKNEPSFSSCDMELNKKTYSYTVDTLTELHDMYPDDELYFIIGEDSLRDLPKWYNPEIIVKKCVLLVYPRGARSRLRALIKERSERYNADIRIINAPIINISSTIIRERIKNGLSVKHMVPDAVEEYIKSKKLYKPEE